MSKQRIYLDYAAATPMDDGVLAAMQPYFSEQFYNPSATYLAGQSVRQKLGQARTAVASHLGARPAEIVFTAGATEANNLAIQGVMRQFPDAEVLISTIEHESVLAPAKLFNHRTFAVDEKGIVDLADLQRKISDKTVLVSLMYVSNELGSIQPLSEAAKIIDRVRSIRLAAGNKTPLYLHSDAAQAGNFLDLHVSRLGVDMMSLNGGKIYGPKQSGALYVSAGVKLQPLIVGGGQEFGLRSGTENVAGIAGFAAALSFAQGSRRAEAERVTRLRELFEENLRINIPEVRINRQAKHRAPHIINVSFTGIDNERLMMQLDELGIICATGSACSASSDKPSHVLSAIGLSDEAARSSLRFSLGRQTTESDIQKTIKALKNLLT